MQSSRPAWLRAKAHLVERLLVLGLELADREALDLVKAPRARELEDGEPLGRAGLVDVELGVVEHPVELGEIPGRNVVDHEGVLGRPQSLCAWGGRCTEDLAEELGLALIKIPDQ